ncbi:MAG: 3-deoxy-manno-octulosonate cytidylyltransferase [Opitutales bacterium]
MSCSVVIPARLASTRLPRKLLLDVGGVPLLKRTWEQVRQMQCGPAIYIVTDSQEIREAAESWGAFVIDSCPECVSGTERIASVLNAISGDFILNVQGDEPFIEPSLLDALVRRGEATKADVITPIFKIEDIEELFAPSVVKVVCAGDGRALYFSRSTVPHVRDARRPEEWFKCGPFWGHVGVYGFRREVLSEYSRLKPSALESIEGLEQLRWIEHGYTCQTVVTEHRIMEVNEPEDLSKAEAYCKKHGC